MAGDRSILLAGKVGGGGLGPPRVDDLLYGWLVFEGQFRRHDLLLTKNPANSTVNLRARRDCSRLRRESSRFAPDRCRERPQQGRSAPFIFITAFPEEAVRVR